MAGEATSANHRLLGTLVLVSLAVIFLPVFFSSDDEFFFQDESFIPEPPDRLKTIVYQINDDGIFLPVADPIEHVQPTDGAEVEQREVSLPAEVVTESARVQTMREPEVRRIPPPVMGAAEKSGELKSWMVQVGSFGRQENARVLRDKIRHSGYAAYLDKRTGANGDIWRVRVGPYASRQEATKAQHLLESEYEMTGLLVRHR